MGKRYTIHEVSKLLGISADAIRLYEKEELIKPNRDPQNGYRYFEPLEIQRIMGIHLYRQLDASITEIREMLAITDLQEISNSFSSFILQTENEIDSLQKKLEKLRFMKQHIDNLRLGQTTYSITELPAIYTLYHQDIPTMDYSNMKDILTSPVFSFGNFCFTLQADENNQFHSDTLEFAIREPMMQVCPWRDKADAFPRKESCRCLYHVVAVPFGDELTWDLSGMLQYAKEHNIPYASHAYAFYVFSTVPEDSVMDFYEIYLPIL